MRVKDDGANSFYAGFATSVVLGANSNLLIQFLFNFSHETKIITIFWYWRWIYDVWFL